jgi:hypothetical protein
MSTTMGVIETTEKYTQWVKEYKEKNPNTARMCKSATDAMIQTFPELTQIRGHVISTSRLDPAPHWWCINITGNIFDPTENQFGTIVAYYPHDESLPEPTGKCPNCGKYCYNGNTLCCKTCEEEYVAYLNGCD